MKKILYTIAILVMSAITSHAQVVVTEIMYNNPGQNNAPDSLEFVEIYNAGTSDVNLLGYTFRTAFRDTLPNYSLKPGAYFVTAVNAAYFKLKFGFDPEKQWSNGTLANNSELIELYDDGGALVDSVRYRSNNPWPAAANGAGSSLVLCDPKADNGIAANWFASSTEANFKINNVAIKSSPTAADCPVIAVTAADKFITTYKGLNSTFLLSTLVTTPAGATITIGSQPKNGTAQIAAAGGGGGGGGVQSIRYTPKVGFCGKDTFQYKAAIGNNFALGNVYVSVLCDIPYKNVTIAKVTGDANKDFIPDSLNIFAELVGVVHSPNFAQTPAVGFCIIDEKVSTDGIFVARNISSGGYLVPTVGDKVTVRGRIVQNAGLTVLLADTILVTGQATAFAPIPVTSLDESTESALVQIKGLVLQTPAAWGQLGGGGGAVPTQFTVTATNGIQIYSIRVNKSIADLFEATAGPGAKVFDLVGIGSQFAAGGGGGGGGGGANLSTGYVIMPRSAADLKIVVPAAANDLALGEAISVAPNPFANELNIVINDNIETLKIVNNLGQIVFRTTEVLSNQTIETSNWSAGIYFLTIEKAGKQYTTKLIK